MAGRGKKKGGVLGSAVVFVIVLSVIFAFWKSPTKFNPDNPVGSLESKSNSIESWAKGIENHGFGSFFDKFKGLGSSSGSDGGNNASESLKDALPGAKSSVDSLPTGEAQSVAYNREEWKHWVTAPGAKACWNVREEVLWRDSDKGAVVMKDSSGKVTKDKKQACSITAGKWNDPYSNDVITDPRKLDVDHMIPLSYAAQHGGQAWDSVKKQKYANDLTNPHHLVSASARENRSKGDKGPSEYMPKVNTCEYAVDWVTVSKAWNIKISPADQKVLKKTLAGC